MPNRTMCLLLMLGVTMAAGAQQFEFAVSGADYPCYVLPIITEQAWFYFPDPPRPDMLRDDPVYHDDIRMIASAPGRTAYGLTPTSAIVRFSSNGAAAPFFGGVPRAHAFAIATTSSGRAFVSLSISGAAHLAVISATGVQEALYPLPGAAFGEQSGILTVAQDGCTVYYASASGIKRINGCTGAPLPDFVVLANVNDVEVLPGGEILVAAGDDVLLYSPSGALVRTVASLTAYGYGTSGHIEEATLAHGVLWIVAAASCDTDLLRVSFETGAEVRPRIELNLVTGTGLIVAASSHVNVPAAGEVALALLAFALAAGGALVLRLR